MQRRMQIKKRSRRMLLLLDVELQLERDPLLISLATHQQRLRKEFHLQTENADYHLQSTKEGNMLQKRLSERSSDTNVLLMDVQIKLRLEECAGGMEQRSSDTSVPLMDVQISSSIEVFA